jgi:hypothetical protein
LQAMADDAVDAQAAELATGGAPGASPGTQARMRRALLPSPLRSRAVEPAAAGAASAQGRMGPSASAGPECPEAPFNVSEDRVKCFGGGGSQHCAVEAGGDSVLLPGCYYNW